MRSAIAYEISRDNPALELVRKKKVKDSVRWAELPINRSKWEGKLVKFHLKAIKQHEIVDKNTLLSSFVALINL